MMAGGFRGHRPRGCRAGNVVAVGSADTAPDTMPCVIGVAGTAKNYTND